MKFVRMPRPSVYEHLNHPFNPPQLTADFSEDDFDEEWEVIRARLKAILGEFGEEDAFGLKDYALSDSTNLSRGIGVTVTSEKLINPELMVRLAMWLRTLDSDYEIYFFLDIPKVEGDFFVNKDTAKGYCQPEVLERLKFDEH